MTSVANVYVLMIKGKGNFIEDLAKEAEDASAHGNMKQLYDITRKLSGKYKHTDRPIKDKNGNVMKTR